jgi:TPR repeat protein
MEAIVDLRLADGAIADSRVLRLEWTAVAATPAVEPQARSAAPSDQKRTLPAAEIAMLVKRGHEFLLAGDIAAARVVLRRAAEAGSPHAALALGVSYDPAALRQAGVVGIAPDVAAAREWYRRAADLGSVEATRRLTELSRAGR